MPWVLYIVSSSFPTFCYLYVLLCSESLYIILHGNPENTQVFQIQYNASKKNKSAAVPNYAVKGNIHDLNVHHSTSGRNLYQTHFRDRETHLVINTAASTGDRSSPQLVDISKWMSFFLPNSSCCHLQKLSSIFSP